MHLPLKSQSAVDLLKKISTGSKAIPIEARRLLKRTYPAFVTASRPDSLDGEVPVFMFHTVDRFVFQQQLEFLKINGYRTLTISSYMAFLRGDIRLNEPSVLLTFDDGEKSWYRVAFPLLKRYSFHAVGFVVPHYLKEQPDRNASKGWLSWPELVEMDRGRVIDVQSHSYYHDRIFVDGTVVDFFHPHFHHNPLTLDVPWIQDEDYYTNQLSWGTPIYRHAPRLEGYPRYLDDERVRRACVAWVESQGGRAFFGRRSWRRELGTFCRTVRRRHSGGRYESTQEQRERILEDLGRARKTLQERLNKQVQHLCYPWGAGSALSVSLSQEAGYISSFWAASDHRRSNRTGDSPFYNTRLKDDYLFRLPGQGRKSLSQILRRKLRRRFETLDLY